MNARNSHMSFLLSFHRVLLSPSYTRLLHSSPPRIIESQTPSFSVFISTPPPPAPSLEPPSPFIFFLIATCARLYLLFFLLPFPRQIYLWVLTSGFFCLLGAKERKRNSSHAHTFVLSLFLTHQPSNKGKDERVEETPFGNVERWKTKA